MNGVQIRIRGKVQGWGSAPLSGSWPGRRPAAAMSVTTATAYWCGWSGATTVLLPLWLTTARRWRGSTVPPAFPIAGRPRRRISPSARAGGTDADSDCARCRDLPGVPRGDERSPGTPLPLPLYQLHPLRPAVDHYSRHALRPALHRNGAVPALFPL